MPLYHDKNTVILIPTVITTEVVINPEHVLILPYGELDINASLEIPLNSSVEVL